MIQAVTTHSMASTKNLKNPLLGQVKAKATRNMDYLDSAATYCNVPLALSLDLASDARDDGIQYRAGLYKVYKRLL